MTRAVDVLAHRALFTQAANHVLDIDDRVVDDVAEGDHQSRQDHGVDRDPAPVQDQPMATSDRGIAVMLISAVRHSNRNAPSIRIMSSAPG